MLHRICLSICVMAALSGCDQLAAALRADASAARPAPPATPGPTQPARIDARDVGAPAASIDIWEGGHAVPQFADFNGDGTLDLFGWVSESSRRSLVAAFDGETGAVLWRTPELTEKAYESWMRLVAGRVVVVDESGKVQAFKPGDTSSPWTTELGERADQICSGDPEQVIVRTTDKRVVAIDLRTGAARPAAPPTACKTDAATLPAVIRTPDIAWHEHLTRRSSRPSVEGMSSESVLAVSPEVHVHLGEKAQGTPVPMLAMLRGEQVVWSTPVPAENPLEARMSHDQIGAADDRGALVLYTLNHDERVAAFAAADGRRLWDLAAEDAKSVIPVEDRVYIVQWTFVSVVDRETGALRYIIGRPR